MNVLYFAWVRERIGLPKEQVETEAATVMELVEELAFGIVQEYRESQKGRLKRTFVSSKDAAEAKVNRGKAKTS